MYSFDESSNGFACRILLAHSKGSRNMNALANSWGLWIARGIASIIFGVLTVLSPAASIAAIVMVYGIYALADGALMLGFAFRFEGSKAWYVVRGLLSIAAGVVALVFPGVTAFALYILVGAWAFTAGVAEIAIAITLRKGALAIAGVLSIIAGIVLIVMPIVGVLALMSFVAAYAVLNGALLIGLGIRIHKVDRTLLAA